MATRFSSLCRGLILALAAAAPLAVSAHAAPLRLWYDTFEDGNTLTWTLSYVGGAGIYVEPGMGYLGTRSLRVVGNPNPGAGATGMSREVPVDFTNDYVVRFGFRYTSFHWDQFLIFGHIRLLLDYPSLPILYDPLGTAAYVGHPLSSEPVLNYLPPETWGLVTVFVRPSQLRYSVYVDGRLVGEVTYAPTLVPARRLVFEDNHSSSNYLNALYDEFSVSGMQDQGLASWITPGVVVDLENVVAQAQPGLVPYHGQYSIPDVALLALHEPCSPTIASGDNYRCLVACLDMLFDYNDIIPNHQVAPNLQEEVSASANINDRVNWNNPGWVGTKLDDGRRAAHFSSATQALTLVRGNCPPAGQPNAPGAWAYTWRSLGYSAVDSLWYEMAADDTTQFTNGFPPPKFHGLLASGYPIVACFDPPDDYDSALNPDQTKGEVDTTADIENTTIGHAVVVMGFDNVGGQAGNPWNVPAVCVHDPARGPFIWIPQRTLPGPPAIPGFYDRIWKFGEFLFAAPWELTWAAPLGITTNAKFQASLFVTYPGPAPLHGLYPVTGKATLTPANGLGFQGGEQATHNLANLVHTGDVDNTKWNLQGPPVVPNPLPACTYEGYGTLNSVASTSYNSYADKLGASGSYGFAMIVLPPPPFGFGHRGWPYGSRWWGAPGSGSGMNVIAVDDATREVSALVWNVGSNYPPAATAVTFWAGDPTLTENYPGSVPIGQVPVPPSLAPGDTVRLTVGPWIQPPANSYGEPDFSIWATIECPGDPASSSWPQEENNHGVFAEFGRRTDIGQPVSLRLRAENPEPTSMFLRYEVLQEEGAEHWTVQLQDSVGALVPTGLPLPVGPGAGFPLRLVVTPTTTDTVGTVHVEGYLHSPGGGFVRQLGGVTLRVHSSGTTDVPPGSPPVTALSLSPPRPNPFSGSTAIRYALPHGGAVRLEVFDLAGRRVRTLVAASQTAGPHEVSWDGRANGGQRLGAGLYLCRFELAGQGVRTTKLLKLR